MNMMAMGSSSSSLRPWHVVSILLLICSVQEGVEASPPPRLRGEDGTLSLLVATPLTNSLDPGFFHLASARLAVDHFNARNASVVHRLESLTQGCNLTFGRVKAVDTGAVNSHAAMQTVFDGMVLAADDDDHDVFVPDAIAGPYHPVSVLDLSAVATGLQSPMVAHNQAFDEMDPDRHSFYTQVSPDWQSEMEFVARYLLHMGRTNYIAVLYDHQNSKPKADILLRLLEQEQNMTYVRTFPYVATPPDQDCPVPEWKLAAVLEQVQTSGYQSIVWLPGLVSEGDAIVELGQAAQELELDQGNHFWIIPSFPALDKVVTDSVLDQTVRVEVLKGAAYLAPSDQIDGLLGGHHHDDDPWDSSSFRTFLAQQDQSFFEQVRQWIPVQDYIYQQDLDYAGNTSNTPLQSLLVKLKSSMKGVAFVYDSVMTLGIGACQAIVQQQRRAITGEQHQEGIRSLDFVGASGLIQFGGEDDERRPGSRVGSTVPFTVANFVLNNETQRFVLQDSERFASGQWVESKPFVFADGSNSPPELRSPPEQNYISWAAYRTGLALFVIAMVVVISSTLWVFCNRNHSVVIAAQPRFLYTICFASGLCCVTIVLAALDESWGLAQEDLDRSCDLWIWFDATANTLIYSALFTKLWRANRASKSSSVSSWHVCWPGVVSMLAVIAILISMKVYGGYRWNRRVVDYASEESVGLCVGDSPYHYHLALLNFVYFILFALSGLMAWKTKPSLSESKWVLALLLVQSQVLLVGAPVIVLLNEINSSARYIGFALLAFSFPICVCGLIILPKVLTVARMSRKAADSPSLRGFVDTSSDSERETEVRGDPLPGRDSVESDSSRHLGPRVQVVTFD